MKSFPVAKRGQTQEVLEAEAHKGHHVDFHFGKVDQEIDFIQNSGDRQRVVNAPPGDLFLYPFAFIEIGQFPSFFFDDVLDPASLVSES